jgi:hypothetical protein
MTFEPHPFDPERVQAETERRNALRSDARLPRLSSAGELDEARRKHERAEFERLMRSPLRARVEEKMLARVRRRRNDPSYVPTGMLSGGGLVFYAAVRGQMRRLFPRLYRR